MKTLKNYKVTYDPHRKFLGTMFEKKKTDDYFRGLGEGEAKAFSFVRSIIAQNITGDPKVVLAALNIFCEYQLLDNPYHKLKSKSK